MKNETLLQRSAEYREQEESILKIQITKKLWSLEEIYKFFNTYNLPKLDHKDTLNP